MAVTIADGDLSYGGAVVETSGGTKYALFQAYADPNWYLEVWKDIDGTPALAGSMLIGASTLPFDAAIDSQGIIRIAITSVTYVYYREFDTSDDLWEIALENAATYTDGTPTNPGCSISIGSTDIPHILYVDDVKYHGTNYDQIKHTWKDGTWQTPELVCGGAQDNYRWPHITCCPADDVEALYQRYTTGNFAICYRRRNGTWGTEGTYAFTGRTNAVTITTGDVPYRYWLSFDNIYENDSDTGYDEGSVDVSAALVGTDRYIFYIDTSDDVHIISNDGGGWTDEGAQQAGTFVYVIAECAYNNEHQSGEINYIFDDGTNVYYDAFLLAAPTEDTARLAGRGDLEKVSIDRLAGRGDLEKVSVARLAARADLETTKTGRIAGLADLAKQLTARMAGMGDLEKVSVDRIAGLADLEHTDEARLAGLADLEKESIARLAGRGDLEHTDEARLAGRADFADFENTARIAGRGDLEARKTARIAGLGDLETSGKARIAGRADLETDSSSRIAGRGDLEKRSVARLAGRSDLEHTDEARLAGLADLETSDTERLAGLADLETTKTDRLAGRSDLEASGKARLAGRADFEDVGEVTVRIAGRSDLEALKTARIAGQATLQKVSVARMAGLADLQTTKSTRIAGRGDLEAVKSSRLAGRGDLQKEIEVRMAGLADLQKSGTARMAGRADFEDVAAVPRRPLTKAGE